MCVPSDCVAIHERWSRKKLFLATPIKDVGFPLADHKKRSGDQKRCMTGSQRAKYCSPNASSLLKSMYE